MMEGVLSLATVFIRFEGGISCQRVTLLHTDFEQFFEQLIVLVTHASVQFTRVLKIGKAKAIHLKMLGPNPKSNHQAQTLHGTIEYLPTSSINVW